MKLLLIPFYVVSSCVGMLNGAGLVDSAVTGQAALTYKGESSYQAGENIAKPKGFDAIRRKKSGVDIAKVNLEWRESQQQGPNLISASDTKNTFTITVAYARRKDNSFRGTINPLHEARQNNLAPVTIDENGNVLLYIPESRNPNSPTSNRKLSLSDA